MKPTFINANVQAHCPNCEDTITTFEIRHAGGDYGSIVQNGQHRYNKEQFSRILYVLMRCASCGRGGIATIHDSGNVSTGTLEDFYPISIDSANLPENVPVHIAKEFREAELCESCGASRAASALFRSVLEKILKANGYTEGSLQQKIDAAAGDGIITESRKKRAHEEIRVLGNDVLHDEWREINNDEVDASHHYAQRILEDFYDDRETVASILISKGKISSPSE